MTTITLTSKGQMTIPAEIRRQMHLQEGDQLVVDYDPKKHTFSLSKPMTVEELAKMTHALPRKKVKPVMDVDAYYQKHRGETIR